MAFSIEVKPQGETTGKVVHTVIVTIDDHETVLTFESYGIHSGSPRGPKFTVSPGITFSDGEN